MKKKTECVEPVESLCKIVESPALEELRVAKVDHKPISVEVMIGGSASKTPIDNLFLRELKIIGPITKASQRRVHFKACGLRRCLSGSICAVTGEGKGTLQIW